MDRPKGSHPCSNVVSINDKGLIELNIIDENGDSVYALYLERAQALDLARRLTRMAEFDTSVGGDQSPPADPLED